MAEPTGLDLFNTQPDMFCTQEKYSLVNKNDEMSTLSVKVVLAGDPATGKTSLARQFAKLEMNDEYSETTQCQVELVNLQQSSPAVVAEVWDHGGRLISEDSAIYFKDSHFVLLTYDITNHHSFESATTKWYRDARYYSSDASCMLIGCKSDLTSRRSVDINEAELFATTHNFFFMEVSSKEHTNIDLTLKILKIRSLHLAQRNVLLPLREGSVLDGGGYEPLAWNEVDAVESRDDFDRSVSDHKAILQRAVRREERDKSSFVNQSSGAADVTRMREPWHGEKPTIDRRRKISSESIEGLSPPRMKYFEETYGHMVPVLETTVLRSPEGNTRPDAHILSEILSRTGKDAKIQKHANPSSQRRPRRNMEHSVDDPGVCIDIDIGDGRTGQIVVHEGENAFSLAESFVRAFRLQQSSVGKLAALIRSKVVELAALDHPSVHRVTKDSISKTSVVPFHFATDERLRERSEVLLKLHVDVGKGKFGTIAVRRGDDPYTLARNFAQTFSLRKELIPGIVSRIKEQIIQYYQREFGSGTLNESFVIRIELGDGREVPLRVSRADDPSWIAKDFGQQYNIGTDKEKKLEKMIREAMR